MIELFEREECNWLENNLLTCLKEKSLKDNVPERKCNVENVKAKNNNHSKLLWFFLECPIRAEQYENKDSLRRIYLEEKAKELNPPKT
jgi:hypothetical protein